MLSVCLYICMCVCVCVCVCPLPPQHLNAWKNLYGLWYVHVYHGTWVHLSGVLHKSLASACAKQRLSKHVPSAKNARNNRRIVGCVLSCAVLVVSKESLCVCLCGPLPLLGNGSVKTSRRQGRIVGSVVFYVANDVSKKSRRLVLPELLAFICGLTHNILRNSKFGKYYLHRHSALFLHKYWILMFCDQYWCDIVRLLDNAVLGVWYGFVCRGEKRERKTLVSG
jgi:hypothetical protein